MKFLAIVQLCPTLENSPASHEFATPAEAEAFAAGFVAAQFEIVLANPTAEVTKRVGRARNAAVGRLDCRDMAAPAFWRRGAPAIVNDARCARRKDGPLEPGEVA